MEKNNSPLAIGGERISGDEVRQQNVLAAVSIANIVKSSLGPMGLDKMLVDDIGDVTVTNDGATILKLLDVEHPAGKILVDLANQQDKEVGDGTTTVVIIAAELLKRANELIKNKIHPTVVITGYRLACKEAVKYIRDNLVVKFDTLSQESILKLASTSISSKIIGGESDFFAKMAVDAISAVKTVGANGKTHCPINSINVLKAHGKRAKESIFVDGYALNCTVASQAIPKKIVGAKIVCLDMSLSKSKMGLSVKIQVEDPDELEKIREREMSMTKDKIELILEKGANVVLTTKGIDDFALKYFVEKNCMAVRRCGREDLVHIARATGTTLITSLTNLDGTEEFDIPLGEAEEVVQERISDDELILIKNPKNKQSSIILRGPNDYMLDEMERALHDCLCVLKRSWESNHVVPGGGCVEAALSIFLENFARTLGSREQLAIAEFAQALLVIPKVLSVNAGQDATDLISKLRSYHHTSQKNPEKEKYKWVGLDLETGKVRDNLKEGVIEPALIKMKSIRAATEAAISILRIDDLIKLDPPPQPDQQHH